MTASQAARDAAKTLSELLKRMDAPCEVRETPTQGKHVVATRPIAAGEVLFEERPLVAWPFHDDVTAAVDATQHCDYCLGPLDADGCEPTPCGDCGTPFCCPGCRKAAAGAHKILCGALHKLRDFHVAVSRQQFAREAAKRGKADADDEAAVSPPPISVEAVARCVAAVVGRFERVCQSVEPGSPLPTVAELFAAATTQFDRLVEPPRGAAFEDIDEEAWYAEVQRLLRANVERVTADLLKAHPAPDASTAVADALLKRDTLRTFLGQLTVNAQSLNNGVVLPPMSPAGASGSTVSPGAASLETSPPASPGGGRSRAGAVYALQSCFNHSCAPNVRIDFRPDSEIALVARVAVPAGAELHITYVPELTLALETAPQRRRRLAPYFFDCACVRCASEDAGTPLLSPAPTATVELFVPGRVALLGEHSDWAAHYRRDSHADTLHPGQCLVYGTDVGLHATADRRARGEPFNYVGSGVEGSLEIPFEEAALCAHAAAGGFFSYACGSAAAVLREFGDRVGPVRIVNTKTTLPQRKGLSSSAAVCVLVVRAFSECYGLGLTPHQEMDLAYKGELLTPSKCGRMDQCVAFGRAAVAMTFPGGDAQAAVTPVACGADFFFVVADLNRGKDTQRILADLHAAFPDAPGETAAKARHFLGPKSWDFVEEAKAALTAGDATRLGRVFDRYQAEFSDALQPQCPTELSSPRLHEVLRHPTVRPHILGGKGVGSQGDGTVQVLCADAATQDAAFAALEALGCTPHKFKLSKTQ